MHRGGSVAMTQADIWCPVGVADSRVMTPVHPRRMLAFTLSPVPSECRLSTNPGERIKYVFLRTREFFCRRRLDCWRCVRRLESVQNKQKVLSRFSNADSGWASAIHGRSCLDGGKQLRPIHDLVGCHGIYFLLMVYLAGLDTVQHLFSGASSESAKIAITGLCASRACVRPDPLCPTSFPPRLGKCQD